MKGIKGIKGIKEIKGQGGRVDEGGLDLRGLTVRGTKDKAIKR